MIYCGNHKEPKHGTMIDFICPIHEDKGIQSKSWSHFHTYTYGCSYCSGRGKTTDDIRKGIRNKDVELISEYLGNEKPIKCKCKKCGYIWTTLPKVLVTNGSGCQKCGREKSNESRRKSIDTFKDELKLVNENIEIVGDYVNTHTKIKCRCKIDGAIWYGYPANLLNNSAGCPVCTISNSERLFLKTLTEIGIQYVPQHTIDGCNYNRNLRFDAFDINNMVAFEYNGEQHYYPVDFAGNGEAWAEHEFKTTTNRDNAKIKFCNSHNIPMIIVPYWEKDNMKSYILNELEKLGIKIA